MKNKIPSKTARKVALNLVTLGSKLGMDKLLPSEVVDSTARLLVESGAVSQSTVRFSRTQTAVGMYVAFDWMMPGQFEAFAHRKVFCESKVRQSIAAGIRQVLILGAGYDTLGWRLAPEFPDVQFCEVDHPSTSSLKAIGIGTMGPRDNLHLIAEDLGVHPLQDFLGADSVWDSKAPSLIVAEGLLMYLPAAAVEDLFKQCAAISGEGSLIAFTYIGQHGDGRPDAGPWTDLILSILKANSEPWLWSIRPEELVLFLEKTDWMIAPDHKASPEKYGVEFVCVASK